MTSKFEQLIEYVINDEEAKAKELFHDIVVEKSREIYENLMNEEEEEESVEESMEEEEESIEESAEEEEESMEESMEEEESIEEDFGGDASDDLIKDVDTKEKDDAEFDDEAEEDGEDMTKDMEKDHDEEGDIEDRVVDLEDKLDELMAEFEALMGDEGHEGHDMMEPNSDEVGGDAFAQDDTADFHDTDVPMTENITLAPTPKPETSEPSFVNKKSTYAANSGQAGMAARPVKNTATEANPDGTSAYKAPTSYADKGRGDLPGAGKFKNVPAKDGSKLEAAPKPKHGDNGSNNRSPLPRG
jgi:hypothetical protein